MLEDEGRVSHAHAQAHAAVRGQLHDQRAQERGQVCARAPPVSVVVQR